MLSDMEIINPLKIRNWDQLVLSSKDCSIFHSSAWAQVLSESYNYVPKYVVKINNNKLDILIPVMEISSCITGRRGVSLPFTDYCDPIIKDGSSIEKVLEYLIKYGKEFHWKYLELRNKKTPISDKNQSSFFYGHTLELTKDANQIFSDFSSSTKRNIKKANREGVKVIICNSLQSIESYYQLHCLTRKKHGLPPQPFYFFRKIYDYIISKDLGFTVLANIEHKTVAAAIYFHFGDSALYKYGAFDISYQKFRPNNLIMWEAIKWYATNGYKYLSFGRTEPDNDGLRRFKSGWGTEERIIKYFRYDLTKNSFIKENVLVSSRQKNIFNLMPIFLSKLVGNVFYKHIG